MAANDSSVHVIDERVIIVQVLISLFLCINFLLITVFFMKDFFYTTMRYIFFALTLMSDCVFLLLTNALLILSYFRFNMHMSLCLIVYVAVSLYTFVTPVTLTAMTLERFVAICMPLRHRDLCSTRSALHCIVIIHGVSSLPCVVVLSIFFATASHSYYTKAIVCSVEKFILHTWQTHLRSAVNQFYFLVMVIIIMFSYFKIMKVARAASGQNRKSTWKGLRTVVLHGFQLFLCLFQLWCPFIDAAVLQINLMLYVNVSYSQVKMPIALCVPVYIVLVVYTFVPPLTLTAMTLECYVAICMPLRYGELCTSRRALHCVLIIHGLSFVPVTFVLSIFFASAPTSLYSEHRICSMNIFVYLRWQDNTKMAVYQLYFFVMSATIIFSYIKIMKAANAASGENKKSSRRALGRVTLHGFHLLFCLILLWCPFMETAALQIDLKLFLNVRYFNYIVFNLTPRCLSPLIYGLRDEKVFLALKQNAPFQFHFGQNSVQIKKI
ncbi:odorant receptor 131-2-like [Solea senegalensis]|uniref:Odorant receptor 131-2-like n=1 Tax=Solea senegalensis TaxID=28829 RepID=A0AAV6PUW3_SOLSE|nr:odorant receptor 131-2-like [Solea senegalensis]